MIETGDPGDPKAVEDALDGLRRLRSVKPKPSTRAMELAERMDRRPASGWPSCRSRPQPPEWLVTPALEALQEAREAVAAAQSGSDQLHVDPARLAALDRAHREVLEAEQRAMKKSSRSNRKKLDAAHEAESSALAALGVTSYGEYLQRVAPNVDNGGGGREERLAAAKAALADAEAVWEELHGGQASPEWTEAKQHQATIRQEALEILGADVDDADARRCAAGAPRDGRGHRMGRAGARRRVAPRPVADVAEDGDLEGAAERWLQESPAKREARAAPRGRARRHRCAVARSSRSSCPSGRPTTSSATTGRRGPSRRTDRRRCRPCRRRLADAEATEREAEESLQRLRFEASAAETKKTVVAALEQTATTKGAEADALVGELAAAEAELQRAAAAASEVIAPAAAATPTASAANGGFDISGVVGMEAEAYLLARVAALRGATGGPLPMVVDGGALSGLSEKAGKRVFRLLGRLADSMQVVILGDDDEIATWAEGLGDRAAVRTVAR